MCTAPEPFHNGVIEGTHNYGNTITYICNDGYRRRGTETRTCGSNQLWSGSPPSCVPEECNPNLCSNRGRCVSSNNDYTCHCVRGYEGRNCEIRKRCIVPSPPQFGTVSILTSSRVVIGSTITYRCNNKYRMEGQPTGQLTVTCRENRTWSADIPTCVVIQCIHRRKPNFATAFPRNKIIWLVGDFVAYTCNPGYEKTSGVSASTCLKSGVWSSSLPTCSKISCGRPEFLLSVAYSTIYRINELSFTYGEIARIQCNKWYERVSGAERWICSEGGTWKSTNSFNTAVPVCKPVCGVSKKPGRSLFNRLLLISNPVNNKVPKNRGEWPWMVFTHAYFTQQQISASISIACGGNLISSRYVLTAALCITISTSSGEKEAIRVDVWLPTLQSRSTGNAFRSIETSLIKRYPQYNSSSIAEYDVSVLLLAETVVMNDYVRPVCIPSNQEKHNLINPGVSGTSVRWCYDYRIRFPQREVETDFTILSHTSCQNNFGNHYTDNHFCARASMSDYNCGADSGSNWMLLIETKYYLYGILSFGIHNNVFTNETDVPVSHFLGFTKIVPNFVDWIRENSDLD